MRLPAPPAANSRTPPNKRLGIALSFTLQARQQAEAERDAKSER